MVRGRATRWLRSHWDEEDILYLFEVGEVDGEDGWVLRQVELQGAERSPRVAADLSEWPDPNGPGGLEACRAYSARYGETADTPVSEWGDFPHDEISADAFEQEWIAARSFLYAAR